MNRIDKTLVQLRASGKKVLSPYITAGDPKPEMTVSLMHELVAAGANILEIGIPFSDPMAEGPVIQAAMERALEYRISCDDVFSLIETFRKTDQHTPIVLMGYVNPIEQYGYERFAKRAKAVGVDGTILVDLPPEESESIVSIWDSNNLYSIYLCSPTTSDERMKLINNYGKGYLYYVSLKGVTGSDDFDLQQVRERYQQRKSQTDLPLMVGFGIKTPAMAARVAEFADGVIVGAALINKIYEAYVAGLSASAAGASLIRDMRQMIDKVE
ncbi:tryptophan synthase subunit alpha [Legionella hackeliae]|uniref:Tryptophan synthase alpha chain n=1 Tax=Legionella hackeliae TaxID=449 RepID=A0A0A8UQC3_LEGHA|nr:tryptophan synthase subunit alpha [Legionella hackeliae]KTD09726.1 tryptophan synthase subunit alpha [Legionella hackeliae]CEK10948.1 Tryptophan synthase alpha chain [Legionella hackeliae]STX47687.1 tryptophan synthase alpha chain [Legionella hackeliae]